MKASKFDKKFDDGVEDMPMIWTFPRRLVPIRRLAGSMSTSPRGWWSRSTVKPSASASLGSRSSRSGLLRSWSTRRPDRHFGLTSNKGIERTASGSINLSGLDRRSCLTR